MEPLHTKKCVPCEGGVQPLTPEQAAEYMTQVKGWTLDTDAKLLSKNIHFTDFRSAMQFVNEVADLAEFEGHHPDLNIHNWNQLTISLATHAIKGLSENDFIMAAKIDRLIHDNQN